MRKLRVSTIYCKIGLRLYQENFIARNICVTSMYLVEIYSNFL